MISHCQCETSLLVNEKELLEDAYLLKKFIDKIAHVSKVFNMHNYYPDFQGELNYFLDEVNQVVTRTEESLIRNLYVDFENLFHKIHGLKKSINSSKMYIDHCIYINTQEFNDLVLPPSQQLDYDQERRYRVEYTKIVDDIHTKMLNEKESQVNDMKDKHKENRAKLIKKVKKLKEQAEAHNANIK